jgi:hypothetical protein
MLSKRGEHGASGDGVEREAIGAVGLPEDLCSRLDVNPGESVELLEFGGVLMALGPMRMESRNEGDKIICTIRQKSVMAKKGS